MVQKGPIGQLRKYPFYKHRNLHRLVSCLLPPAFDRSGCRARPLSFVDSIVISHLAKALFYLHWLFISTLQLSSCRNSNPCSVIDQHIGPNNFSCPAKHFQSLSSTPAPTSWNSVAFAMSKFRISSALWDKIHHFASFPQTGGVWILHLFLRICHADASAQFLFNK